MKMTAVVPRLARRVGGLRPSAIREMLRVTQNPEIISFGGGLPAAELFPVDDIAAAQERVMRARGAMALQYSLTEGIPELRAWVAARVGARTGLALGIDDVIITGGSQQGLDLYARVLLDPGDVVAVENPSYLGAIQAFDGYEAEYLTVASDEHGIIPDAIDAALRGADPLPKFLYLVPNFENPTGATLAAERRARVVAICADHGVPILEDDPYGDIAFEHAAPPALLGLAERGAVSYLGTGSKMVAPGLRVAWLVVPDAALREKIVTAKQGADLHSSTYAQYVFHAYVEDEQRVQRHLARVCATYRARRDAMVQALRLEAPSLQFSIPEGGMFLWATARAHIDTEELFAHAVRDGVVFVPGRPFYANRERGDGMRLNFSAMPEPRIREGIARLGRALGEISETHA